MLLFKFPLVKQALIAFIIVIALNIYEVSTRAILSMLSLIFKDYVLNIYIPIVVSMVLLTTILYFSSLYIKKNQINNQIFWLKTQSYIILAVLSFVLFVILTFLSAIFSTADAFDTLQFHWIVILFYCGILIVLGKMISLYISKKMIQQESLVQKEELTKKEAHYQNILSYQNEIRKIKHDIKNNLNTIQLLLKADEVEKAQDFISQLSNKIEKIPKVFFLGNQLADLIINDKINNSSLENINLQLLGKLPDDLPLTSLDICTIFSNILDNMLEACAHIEGSKTLIIKVEYVLDDITICFKNPCIQKSIKQSNLPRTTKNDKIKHGFGMQNVKDCLSKYDGTLCFQCNDYIFTTIVSFKKNS